MGPKEKLPEPEEACFTIMPFGEKGSDAWLRSRKVYEEIIVKAVEQSETGLVPLRVDDITRPGSITDDIIKYCVKARVVIADLTDKNPNVLYELGVRHARSHRTILMAEKRERLPFDTNVLRTVFYSSTTETDMDEARLQLIRFIHGAFEANPLQDSPVLKLYPIMQDSSLDSISTDSLNGLVFGDRQPANTGLVKSVALDLTLKGYEEVYLDVYPSDWRYFTGYPTDKIDPLKYAASLVAVSKLDHLIEDRLDFQKDLLAIVVQASKISRIKELTICVLLTGSDEMGYEQQERALYKIVEDNISSFWDDTGLHVFNFWRKKEPSSAFEVKLEFLDDGFEAVSGGLEDGTHNRD